MAGREGSSGKAGGELGHKRAQRTQRGKDSSNDATGKGEGSEAARTKAFPSATWERGEMSIGWANPVTDRVGVSDLSISLRFAQDDGIYFPVNLEKFR
jgi:hypothetical protein